MFRCQYDGRNIRSHAISKATMSPDSSNQPAERGDVRLLHVEAQGANSGEVGLRDLGALADDHLVLEDLLDDRLDRGGLPILLLLRELSRERAVGNDERRDELGGERSFVVREAAGHLAREA